MVLNTASNGCGFLCPWNTALCNRVRLRFHPKDSKGRSVTCCAARFINSKDIFSALWSLPISYCYSAELSTRFDGALEMFHRAKWPAYSQPRVKQHLRKIQAAG